MSVVLFTFLCAAMQRGASYTLYCVRERERELLWVFLFCIRMDFAIKIANSDRGLCYRTQSLAVTTNTTDLRPIIGLKITVNRVPVVKRMIRYFQAIFYFAIAQVDSYNLI